jgi:hypothetical protein
MATNNQQNTTSRSILEQFEIDPSQGVEINISYSKREYQTSNIIFQDPGKDGILQFFNNEPADIVVETTPTSETSTRPNRSSGGY